MVAAGETVTVTLTDFVYELLTVPERVKGAVVGIAEGLIVKLTDFVYELLIVPDRVKGAVVTMAEGLMVKLTDFVYEPLGVKELSGLPVFVPSADSATVTRGDGDRVTLIVGLTLLVNNPD